MPSNPTAVAQQITVTSPSLLRSAKEPFSQALARDIEALSYQLNQLLRAGKDSASVPSSAGAWQPWTPSISAAPMTISVSSVSASWLKLGSLVLFRLYFRAVLSGNASSTVFASLPAQRVLGYGEAFGMAPCLLSLASGWVPGNAFITNQSGGQLWLYPSGGTNYPLGQTDFLSYGFYGT
jgi:hypothetical protein